MTYEATVTFKVGADQKLTHSQVFHAILITLQMNESFKDICPECEPIGDYSSNYVRVPIDGVKWEAI